MSLNENQGFTTIGRKPKRVKAIWCHFYRRNKETGPWPNSQLMKMKLNRKIKNPNRNENMSNEDFVFADLGKQISPLIITFVPDEQFLFFSILHWLLEPHETVSTMKNTNIYCLLEEKGVTNTNGGWGGILKYYNALWGFR